MKYLQTRSGLLAEKSIVLIGGINTRPGNDSYIEVEYVHGGEARATTARPDAVQSFLDGDNQ